MPFVTVVVSDALKEVSDGYLFVCWMPSFFLTCIFSWGAEKGGLDRGGLATAYLCHALSLIKCHFRVPKCPGILGEDCGEDLGEGFLEDFVSLSQRSPCQKNSSKKPRQNPH